MNYKKRSGKEIKIKEEEDEPIPFTDHEQPDRVRVSRSECSQSIRTKREGSRDSRSCRSFLGFYFSPVSPFPFLDRHGIFAGDLDQSGRDVETENLKPRT